MTLNNILILGDSTSMTIGYHKITFPYILSKKKIWSKNSKIINSSIHGFSSADALKFIKNNTYSNLDAVILNLGICDSISNENPKKKYINNFINKLLKKKNKNINKISNDNWNDKFDNQIGNSETLGDFKYNIDKIISYCLKKNYKLILLIPDSNFYFHPGLAKGNFQFYKYINLSDSLPLEFQFDSKDLKQAFRYFEEKNFTKSKDLFLKILKNNHKNENNTEFYHMLSNNYAISSALSGDFNESINTLLYLSEEVNIRKEIIYYNLSQIYLLKNDNTLYEKYLLLSYNFDKNTYRIKNSFRSYLLSIKSSNDIFKIDIKDIINKNYYDHCHMDKIGHISLADKISNLLTDDSTVLKHHALIKNHLFNPSYSNGNDSNFNDFFNLTSNVDTNSLFDEIKKIHMSFDEVNNIKFTFDNKINENILSSINSFSKHPIFVDLSLLSNFTNLKNFYFGKFPEFFLIQLVGSLFISLNKYHCFDKLDINSDLFLSDLNRREIFHSLNLDTSFDENSLNINHINFIEILPLIIKKIKKSLFSFCSYPTIFHNRRKHTMLWFLRESIRFGTHSRISMFFDFISLQNIYESIIIYYGVNKYFNLNHLDVILELKELCELVFDINLKFTNDNEALFKKFDMKLDSSVITSQLFKISGKNIFK